MAASTLRRVSAGHRAGGGAARTPTRLRVLAQFRVGGCGPRRGPSARALDGPREGDVHLGDSSILVSSGVSFGRTSRGWVRPGRPPVCGPRRRSPPKAAPAVLVGSRPPGPWMDRAMQSRGHPTPCGWFESAGWNVGGWGTATATATATDTATGPIAVRTRAVRTRAPLQAPTRSPAPEQGPRAGPRFNQALARWAPEDASAACSVRCASRRMQRPQGCRASAHRARLRPTTRDPPQDGGGEPSQAARRRGFDRPPDQTGMVRARAVKRTRRSRTGWPRAWERPRA